ncbi:MAG: hypothetical protein CVU63_05310 [Deltaproteobacteria bacterium HGW-Deltaproteobacteria-20]|nr:MAG: hypothetical protein CVU63_05310 [Deltaproteobacteria bacterium HGW-Deltaproteobacteria-20]
MCALATGLCDRAMAQTASEIAAARQWFEGGLALEEQGRWDEALALFRRAAEVKQTPQLLFHQGLCEKHTGLLVKSILSLSRSVGMARQAGLGKVEEGAQVELTDARERAPVLQIVLPEGVQPDRVMLDGIELSSVFFREPFPVNPGVHEVVVARGATRTAKSVTLEERASARVSFDLASDTEPPATHTAVAEAPVAGPTRPARGPTEKPSTDTEGSHTLAWSLVGAGALAVAGGGWFWMKRGDELERIDGICPTRDQCPLERKSEIEDMKSRGTTYSSVGLGLAGLGVASVAVGGVLLFGSENSASTRAEVVPVGGPGHAGALVRGRF